MKKIAGSIALAMALLPNVAAAADLGIDAATVFRFEERSSPGLEKQKIYPATQFVGVDIGNLADGNLSFHLSGWGRIDLGDQSRIDGTSDSNLAYGYLQYRTIKGNGRFKAGRFFIYDVGPVEQIDGVSAGVDLDHGFMLSGFGGMPVKLDQANDNKGDSIFGGRLGYRYGRMFEIGLAVLHEQGAASREYVPAANTLRLVKDYRQLAAVDLWLAPNRIVELYSRASYDTAVKEMSEQSHMLTVRPARNLSLSGEYNEQKLQSMFAASSLPPTVFSPIAGTSIKSYGTVATYTVAPPLEITGDFRHTSYEKTNRGDSNRFGLEARLLLLDGKLRSGLGYHMVDAQAAGINSYNELRAYGTYTAKKYFASLDLLSHLFKNAIYNRKNAYAVTASAGYRLTSDLTLSGDISYGSNPWMTTETRGLLKLTYNYESKGGPR